MPRPSDRQESFSFLQEPKGGPAPRPPFDPKQLYRLAAEGVFLGTSSWKYRGWEGMIYQGGYVSEAQFQKASLREYTSYFPCVGVDFTYFTWPLPEMMCYLADSTPENFRLCPKVTKRITLSTFPDLPAYGKWAGKPNPDFLKADLFVQQYLKPMEVLRGRLGVILFEFSGPDEKELGAMKKFFEQVPRESECAYAVEIRNPELVNPDFYRMLRELNVSPAFSFWTKMPPIAEQWAAYRDAGGAEDASPLVGLGFLQPGISYDEAVRRFQPYREWRAPYEEGREELAALGSFARQNGRKAFILVNNRFEGSAPYTVGALVQSLERRKNEKK